MPDAPASLSALALAVRERLLSGGAAVLPGLGTLARVHVPARVDVRAEGQRVLLPPGESVALSGAAGDAAPLAALVVRHLGTPQADPGAVLRTALDHLEARLAATGQADLAGVGAFQRTSGGVRFAAAPALLAAVNRPFAGLPPIGRADVDTEPPPAPPPPGPLVADSSTPIERIDAASYAAPVSGRYVPTDAVPDLTEAQALAVEPDAPPSFPPTAAAEALPAPDEPPPDEPFAGEAAPDLAPDAAEAPAAEWTSPSLPPPDTLGLPDDIEDADYSVLDAPLAGDATEPLPLTDETPDDLLADEPAVQVERAGMNEGVGEEERDATVAGPALAAPLPSPEATAPGATESAASAEASQGDQSRARWQQAAGWLMIAIALGLATWLVVHDRYGVPDRADPALDPSERAPALAAPVDTVAVGTLPLAPEPADAEKAARIAALLNAEATDETGLAARPVATPVVAGAGGVAARVAAPEGRALGRAPQPGQAILPPRIAGLPDADVEALASAASVDPSEGGTTWVVLATPSSADADALAARYRSAGYRTGVLRTPTGGRAFRVVVGQFATREQALRLRDRLPPQAPPDTWPLSL